MMTTLPVTDQNRASTIRLELAKVLSSSEFEKAPALGRLLSFVVEEDLAGRSAELKETTIGHGLYGREPTYDTKIDSVVRVNANRLRVRLDEYYRGQESFAVRIHVLKGSYVPT